MPRWLYTEILPEPYTTYQGAYNPNNRDIYLNKSMELKQAEIVASHELTHATNHYLHPATIISNDDPTWAHIGSKIQSCLQDVDVFSTLANFGFDVSDELNLRKNEALFFSRIPQAANDLILAISFVEYYYYFHKDPIWAEIEGNYKTYQPKTYETGSALLNYSFESNFSDPFETEAVHKKWVSFLGIGDIVEIVMPSRYNPGLLT
jgi:hypothetical protein